jgi:hypothetical protein
MSRRGTRRLGAIPSATGTLTRAAYTHARTNGINSRNLLRKANLTLQQIDNASERLRVRDQINFLNLVADELPDDQLGFHLAQPIDLRELGFLYYVAASSKILGEALQKLARYSVIANEGVSVRYSVGKRIGITFHYIGVSRHLDRHQIEFFMAMLVRLCRQFTGIHLVPDRVSLAHRRDGQQPELRAFFGSNVEFCASVDEVSFAPIVRNMPIVSADHHLNKLLTAYCEEALRRRPTKRGSFRAGV